MSHSLQAVAVLAQAAGAGLAVPMAARIHEGIGWSNRDGRAPYIFTQAGKSFGLNRGGGLSALLSYGRATTCS